MQDSQVLAARRAAAPLERLLTVDELAEWLGKTRSALYVMNSRGTGPPYLRAGRLVRYPMSGVRAWLGLPDQAADDPVEAVLTEVLR
jgi:predicted DNA-binding transcriptional regulator AlpA